MSLLLCCHSNMETLTSPSDQACSVQFYLYSSIIITYIISKHRVRSRPYSIIERNQTVPSSWRQWRGKTGRNLRQSWSQGGYHNTSLTRLTVVTIHLTCVRNTWTGFEKWAECVKNHHDFHAKASENTASKSKTAIKTTALDLRNVQ